MCHHKDTGDIICLIVTILILCLKQKAELVPSTCKKAYKRSWSFGRSGMMDNGGMQKAMDMKSRLMVIIASVTIHSILLKVSFITFCCGCFMLVDLIVFPGS